MFKLSRRSKSRLKGINKIMYKIAVNGVKDCPIDFGIPQTGGLRTEADQMALYNTRTAKGKRVTNCDGIKKKSYHQSGNAFDIYAYVSGKATWKESYYKKIAAHLIAFAKREYNINLRWGGNWRNPDCPHFEIRGVK